MKSCKVIIKKDKNGDYTMHYELDGFSGMSCDEVANVMASAGTMSDRKTTDSAYNQEIPVPVPNHQLG